MSDELQKLRDKYSCTAPDNGGWCDGTRNGSRMRCSKYMRCRDGSGACQAGIEHGFDEMDRIAAEMG